MVDKIEKGDHVIVGGGKVHWEVLGVRPVTAGSPNTVLNLRSGLSARNLTIVTGPSLVQVHIFKRGTP